MEPGSDDLLFDSAFLTKLEQLYLLSRKLFRGEHRAERKSRQIGSSLEFADYRNYTFGDDLRNIDWNIYGRLDRLFVKLFEEEQDLHLYFLIDTSASMRWEPESSGGRPGKLNQARRVAASLAYIALANLDRVNIHYFDDGLAGDMGLTRGKSQFHKVLAFLRRLPATTPRPTNFTRTFRSFTQRLKRRGLVFVISDFFDPGGYEEGLSLLQFNQFDLHAIQIVDPAELDPGLSGDLRLRDSETDSILEITGNPALLRTYQTAIRDFNEGLERFCLRRGIGYALASTAIPFEELVLRVLREGSLVK